MASKGDPEKVDSIIASVKQFKKFKQMAQYNISCLLSHITPPTVGWQANVRYAVESGGIESIIDILKQHPKALEVVRTAIEALRLLAVNSRNAGLMAKAGAISAALTAMSGADDEVAESGAALMTSIAKHNPEAVTDSKGSVEAIVNAVETASNLKVSASCLNTLDRISRTEKGSSVILKAGGIKAVLTSIGPDKDTTEEQLKPAFRLLERFAKDKENMDSIKKNGGLEAVVSQLDAHSDNEVILRAGGRLLAKLAENDVELIIQKLKDENLPIKVREFMMQLISNLCLRPEMVDKIVKNGGIPIVIDQMNKFDGYKGKLAAAKALARMADSPAHIDEIIKNNGINALNTQLKNCDPDDDELKAAAIRGLANLGNTKENINKLIEAGADDLVLQAMKEAPHQDGQVSEAIRFWEQLLKNNHDMTPIVGKGIVMHILKGMDENERDEVIHRRGMRVLDKLMQDKYSKGSKTGAQVAKDILDNNGVPTMLHTISNHKDNNAIVETTLSALNELNAREPKNGPKAILSADNKTGINQLNDAIYEQTIKGNRAIDPPSKLLIPKLTSPKEMGNIVKRIKKIGKRLVSEKNENDADELQDLLKSVVANCKVKANNDALVKNGINDALLDTMNDILHTTDVPFQDSLIGTYANTISALARADKQNLMKLIDQGAIQSVINPIKQLSDHTDAVIPCLNTLKTFSTPNEGKPEVVNKGGIEGVVASIRSNPNDHKVFTPALETLLQLSTTDHTAAQVAKKGGTRQIIKGILDNNQNPEFERPVELSVMTLERVLNTKGDDKIIPTLKKQGGIDATIKAMEAFPKNETIEAIGARVLAKLLDRDGVENLVDQMKKLVDEFSKAPKKFNKLADLSRTMATVGYLALAEDNIDIMKKKNAAGTILDALKNIDKLPHSEDTSQARKAGFRALGQIASNMPLDEGLGAPDYVLKSLKSELTPFEKIAILDCIKSMALSEKAALELVKKGCVKDIVDLMRKNPHDEGLNTAAFGALAALTEHEFGVDALNKANGLDVIQTWLDDNADTASPRAMEEAFAVLSNLALVESNVPLMHDGGVVDNVMAALDNLCTDDTNPQPFVLTSAIGLLGRLAIDEDSIKLLAKKGVLKRLIEIAESHPAYLSDPEAMESLLFLLETCGLVDEVRGGLVHDGAIDMIMAAMNLNASNEDVIVTGGRALQTLLGSSPETMKELLQEVQKKAEKLKKKPADRETQEDLAQSLQNLSNLTLIDGVVTDKTAKDIAKGLTKLIHTLNDLPDGPVKSKLLAQAINALGRIPLVDGAIDKMNPEDCIKELINIMKNNPNDEALNAAALTALGNLLQTPGALKVLASLGGIDAIQKAMDNFASSDKIQNAGKNVLNRAKDIMIQNPDDFKGKDLDALAQLMRAYAGDSKGLRDLIRLMAKNGGLDNLLSLLGNDMDDDLLNELLDNLKDILRYDTQMELHFTDPRQLQGILSALRSGDLDKQKAALDIIKKLGPQALKDLMKAGGIKDLLDLLDNNLDDADLCKDILDTLNNMLMADPNLALKLLNENNANDIIKKVLKYHEDDKDICAKAMNIIKQMAKIKGLEKLNLDDDLLRILSRMNEKYGLLDSKDPFFLKLDELAKEDGPDMIGVRLDEALLGTRDADEIVEMKAEDGRVYYFNKTTGKTTWEKPKAYAQLVNAYEGLAKLTDAHKDNIQAIDPKTLNKAVGQFKDHQNEPQRLTALAKALAALASNPENRSAIAAAGGLQAIIQALQQDNIDPEFLDAAINLLNQFAKEDGFKDQISGLGGIRALIAIMLKLIDHQIVVEKCLSTLANLCYNSEVNMKEVMVCKGVEATNKVMKRYEQEPAVLQLAMVLLSNLMFGEDENRSVICKVCGDDIVNVIKNHVNDNKCLTGALKAVGNLTFTDENIVAISNKKCTKHIVKAMDKHPKNNEVLQIGIDVIGNFASLQEDEKWIQKKIKKGELDSIFNIIMMEGGGKKILETVKESEDAEVIMSGMDALAKIAFDPKSTDILINLGIVEMTIEALQKYDWDEAIVERTVHLLATLTYNDKAVKLIVEAGGIQLLLSAIETHSAEPDFLLNAIIALKNIASKSEYRKEIGKLKGVEGILKVMEENTEQKPLLMEILLCLVRLSMNTPISEQIAQQGMHIILKTIHQRKDDDEYLTQAFILLGHLAFAHNNLKIIVQYGGIALIIDSICNHPDKKNLVMRSIQSLDNVAMANSEHAKIVIEAGGEKTIKEVIKAYSFDPEVVQAGKSALLSMSALESRAEKPRRKFLNHQEDEVDPNVDPLKDYRNMLKSGAVFQEWSSGGPYSRHLYALPDFRSIAWKDPKKGAKRGNTLQLRDIRVIRAGITDGHKRGRKQAQDSSCCFSIVGRTAVIDFEAKNKKAAAEWVAALQALLHCFKKTPHWLKG